MKLYTSPASPFGSRVTIAVRAKGLDIESVRPPSGVRSPEYLNINPIGKIPALVTESGVVVPESEAILDYLEDRFPVPSLRPCDPEGRARINIAIRVIDTYVMTPVIRLFPHLNPALRNAQIVADEVNRCRDGLAVLAHFMREPLPRAEAGLSLADCVLSPSLHLCDRIGRILELKDDFVEAHEALIAYQSQMSRHPVVGPVLIELTNAQAEYDAKADSLHRARHDRHVDSGMKR